MITPKVTMEQIAVEPFLIDITEVDRFVTVGFCLAIEPAYYKCVIRITPYVIQQMVQWLIAEEYLELNGHLTVPIRGRKINYVG